MRTLLRISWLIAGTLLLSRLAAAALQRLFDLLPWSFDLPQPFIGYLNAAALLPVSFAVILLLWSMPTVREKCFEKRRTLLGGVAALGVLILGVGSCWMHPGIAIRVIYAVHLPAPAFLLHRDSELDLELLTAKAEAGDAKVQFELFQLFSGTRDSWKGEQWLKRSADLGYDKAAVEMGDRAEDAGDRTSALAWYRKAALQGHAARADEQLGFAYLTGEGVPRDCWKAHSFFEAAAEKGEEGPAMTLSEFYFGGFRCPELAFRQDLIKACKWLFNGPTLGNDSTCDSRVRATCPTPRFKTPDAKPKHSWTPLWFLE